MWMPDVVKYVGKTHMEILMVSKAYAFINKCYVELKWVIDITLIDIISYAKNLKQFIGSYQFI